MLVNNYLYLHCVRNHALWKQDENAMIMFSSPAIGATWQPLSIEGEDRGDQWCESTTILLLIKLDIIL